ncbi:hypothetical protein ABT187_43875 [Streptomyces sp. NPDC001817]|uniref:hypothetical protein n=1 Tax=Streptomyces sp. NPDC001817 TaxID=3154398 RepID=UPI00332759CF
MNTAQKIALAVTLIALVVGGIVISSVVQDQHRREQQHQNACDGVTIDPNGEARAVSAFPTDCP